MSLATVYIAFAFVIIIVLQEFIHYKERKDLYNRIMARDLPEYKAADGSPPKGRNGIKKKIEDTIHRRS
jgi:hypothetical protein